MHVKNALLLELLFSCSRTRSCTLRSIAASIRCIQTQANDVLCKRLSFRRNKYVSTSYGNSRDTVCNQISVTLAVIKLIKSLYYREQLERWISTYFQQSFLPPLKKEKKRKLLEAIENAFSSKLSLSLSLCFRWRSDKTTGEFGDLATS